MNSEKENGSIKQHKVHTGCINTTPFLLQRVTTCKVIRREINLKIYTVCSKVSVHKYTYLTFS